MPIITSLALITAYAAWPGASFSSSTDSLVMAAVTVWPPMSTFTCAVVALFFTSTILRLSLLRALIFMARLLVEAASRPRRIGIGEEQFLPVDLVIRDRLLALGRDEPVDEGLAERLLYVRMLFGIDQHDAVLVEQALVAGD